MSESRMPVYIIGFDEGDYYVPLAAALTRARAEQTRIEIVDHLVEEARRRWKIAFQQDPEIRPFDENGVLTEMQGAVIFTDWDVSFLQTDEPTDPHILRLAVKAAEEYGNDALFEP